MIFIDHVYCDLCLDEVGQLYHQPAQSPDLIFDMSKAPHFVICPVCRESTFNDQDVAA